MDAIATVNRCPGKLWAFLQFPLTRFLLAFIVLARRAGHVVQPFWNRK